MGPVPRGGVQGFLRGTARGKLGPTRGGPHLEEYAEEHITEKYVSETMPRKAGSGPCSSMK